MKNSIKQNIADVIADLGLTIESEFVPFSQSRNKTEKNPSLNWLVTLKRNEREILTTEYMAGMGHCTAYKASKAQLGHQYSVPRDTALREECETGRPWVPFGRASKTHEHKPKITDFLYSLVRDADALDYSTFENWASNYGYDADSRKAESIYRACLEIALKLRNGIGEEGLAKLRDTFQDY